MLVGIERKDTFVAFSRGLVCRFAGAIFQSETAYQVNRKNHR